MQPSRRTCLLASVVVVLSAIFLLALRAPAETLTITSSPAGAKVEIDGLAAGTTPYESDFPSGYFHKTHTVFSARLDHSMVVKISKEGYVTQQITLTSGPFEWIGLTGRQHGDYFLLKTSRLNVQLDAISHGNGQPAETIAREGPLATSPASPAPLRADGDETHVATGRVTITSDTPDAEIYVDGKFVGQTPSTIQLPSGSHRIEIKSRGKEIWERNLEVLNGSVLSLHSALEESP